MFRSIALTALAAFAMFMAGCVTCGNHCGSGGCNGGCHGDHGCAAVGEGAAPMSEPAPAPPAETVPTPPPAESGGLY